MTADPTLADVLHRLTLDPGRPRLTWYGPDAERIELSGAVLANWVAKTTNLLVEEFDAGPGTRVALDLPAHWRTVVWALAAWRCGAGLVVGDGVDGADTGDAADVLVTDRPAEHLGADGLVAVALPALARAFDGDLPRGAVDAAGAVMTYGDVVGWVPATEPDRPAVVGPVDVRHGDLAAWAAAAAPGAGARLLLPTGAGRTDDVVALLRTALGAFAADGSVVVLAPVVAAELAADPARRERLVASERVTAG